RGNIPNIELVRRDIKISAKQYILICIAHGVEKPAQSLQPVELKMKLISPQLAPVWNISVNDPDAVDRGRDQSLRSFVIVVEIVFLNIFDREFRNDGHTVVRLLAHEGSLVAGIFQIIQREIFIHRLCSLKTHNIDFRTVEPAEQLRHTNIYRIHIPGS